MSAHVLQIGRQRFVCGLFWQSLSRPRELHQEAVELGRRIKFDLMVLHKDTGIAQAGYANAAEGVRAGMYSLAATVAQRIAAEGAFYDGRQQPVHNWLAAFSLPDGQWAYCAVRDENFLPNGDFAGTREEVIERLSADYSLGGWNVVFGDESLRSIGLHNLHPRQLDDLLTRRRNGELRIDRQQALQSLSARRERLLQATVAAAGIAVLAGTWMLYDQHRRAEGRRLLASAISSARHGSDQRGNTPTSPWRTQLLPADFLRECQRRLDLLTPGGWTFDSYECSAGSVLHSWKRGDAVVADLLQIVPQATVATDGNTARWTEPMPRPDAGNDDALPTPRAALAAVESNLQALGLTPKVAAIAEATRHAAASGSAPHVPPPWQAFRLQLRTGGLRPEMLAKALQQPGVRLLKANFNGEDWSIEGVIYAK
jgi:hypothetical protein